MRIESLTSSIIHSVVIIATSSACAAQMGSPKAAIDPLHMTEPICNADRNDGIDIAIPVGTPVLAPASGVVSAVWNDKIYGCGLTVMIKLQDGSIVGLAGLSDSMVAVGLNVKQGQVVAHSGQSANATSPSLHYTLYTQEQGKIDPRQTKTEVQKDTRKFTDSADLQKALTAVDDLDESPEVKRQIKQSLINEFYKARSLADAEYGDNLKKAADAWYGNGKNWRKIPSDLWIKLREADRGRFKSGIDPELRPDAGRR